MHHGLASQAIEHQLCKADTPNSSKTPALQGMERVCHGMVQPCGGHGTVASALCAAPPHSVAYRQASCCDECMQHAHQSRKVMVLLAFPLNKLQQKGHVKQSSPCSACLLHVECLCKHSAVVPGQHWPCIVKLSQSKSAMLLAAVHDGSHDIWQTPGNSSTCLPL